MKFFWFLHRPNLSSHHSRDFSSALRIGGLRVVIWITFVILLVFVAWANWAQLDQISRAQGSVIASSKTQIIQSMDGGTIQSIPVHEGDNVEAGQIILSFDKTRTEAGYLEARAKHAALLATVARLTAEVLGTPLHFPEILKDYPEFTTSQKMLFAKRQAAVKEELSALQDQMKLVQEELDMTAPLVKSGDVSRTEVLRLQRQVSDLKAQQTNKQNKYFQDAQTELNKAQEDLASVDQNMAQRKNQLEFTDLRAPVKGVVKNVRVTTVGGVIRAGEEVMQIVPLEDALLIQAKVSPTDIAFLKIGQDVRVKIDAYDYTIYGDIPGKLTYISADTISEDLKQGESPYYRVQVTTSGRKFTGRPDEDLEIQPGMTATIEVKTGSRTVFQYLTKPVLKTIHQSLGER